MLNRVIINNFGPLSRIDWPNLGTINLVIGDNGCGKTFLLKALYCAIRTLEEFKRGQDKRSASEILADKLYWTMQVEKIGDLVSKDASEPLSCRFTFDNRDFFFSFGRDTTKHISTLENNVSALESNSVFFPAKEVLSLYQIILKSRDMYDMFGFDETYLDLARALSFPTLKGKNYPEFAESRRVLRDILGGKVEYEESANIWQYKKGNRKYAIGATSEGVKKIAVLDTLLGNRYLGKNSIVFIDEPEAALHPGLITKFLDIIAMLSEVGIQFFLASHSYFVVKKLYLTALEKNMSIPIISGFNGEWRYDDLKEGMPDNPIIDESINLYNKEVGLALK